MSETERLAAIADTAEAVLEKLETSILPSRTALNMAMRAVNVILERARPTLPSLDHAGWDRLAADVRNWKWDNVEPLGPCEGETPVEVMAGLVILRRGGLA